MSIEITFANSFIVTFITSKIIPCVISHMCIEMTSITSFIITFVTFKRFLPCVRSHMCIEISSISSYISTFVTFKPISRMNLFMGGESFFTTIALFTFITFPRSSYPPPFSSSSSPLSPPSIYHPTHTKMVKVWYHLPILMLGCDGHQILFHNQ